MRKPENRLEPLHRQIKEEGMINIEFSPKTLELKINGHAGQGKKGKDIVCSAVSTLFYTLGEALMQSVYMLKEEPVIKDADGDGYIVCTPEERFMGNITRTYWTVLVGMQMIAENYPKNVKFTVKE
jgi:uncharacterized protein YsxB (DUF464 family)